MTHQPAYGAVRFSVESVQSSLDKAIWSYVIRCYVKYNRLVNKGILNWMPWWNGIDNS